MPYNEYLFKDIYEQMLIIIENSKDCNIKKKRKKLEDSYQKLKKNNDCEVQEFYSIVHELKVYDYLNGICDLGVCAVSDDHAGPDYKISDASVECVNVTKGEGENLKWVQQTLEDDYNRSESILPRLTSVINDKKNKFTEYKNKEIIKDNPMIIVVSPGIFAFEFNSNLIFYSLIKALYGIGNPVVNIFDHTIYNKYSKRALKHNNSSIELDLFQNEDFQIISGVIFVNRTLNEIIDFDTFIYFENPYALKPWIPKCKIKRFGLIGNSNDELVFGWK